MKRINQNYSNYTYEVNEDERTVVAKTTFAGKEVTAKAKCHENDTFDAEVGKRIAAARCNMKVAHKRVVLARKKMKELTETSMIVNNDLKKAADYLEDAINANKVAINKCTTCLAEAR